MKHTAILFSLFFALIFQTACERKQEIRPEILKAEALMDSLPEEAKRILVAEAPHMGNATEGERMKFALLKNKAEDKLYQTHTNDSMMKVVLEYYKKNGTLEERMEAYYQLAGVYRDKHDAPRAIACYTQAMIIGEGYPAPAHREILGRIYAELAWLLDNQRNTGQALELARKKSRLYGDSDYYSLHELGAAFRHNGQRDSAIHFLKAARMALARQQHVDTAEMLTIYGSGLATGIKDGRQRSGKGMLRKVTVLQERCAARTRAGREVILLRGHQRRLFQGKPGSRLPKGFRHRAAHGARHQTQPLLLQKGQPEDGDGLCLGTRFDVR